MGTELGVKCVGGGEGSKGDVTVAGTELGVTRWRCLPGW